VAILIEGKKGRFLKHTTCNTDDCKIRTHSKAEKKKKNDSKSEIQSQIYAVQENVAIGVMK
jgi:hypothetical protein